jgi:hypothetical protein
MIELEIYAPGLSPEMKQEEFRSQMDLLPKVRYKVDAHHDVVFFEVDEPSPQMLGEILLNFTNIELTPRIVGDVPTSMLLRD